MQTNFRKNIPIIGRESTYCIIVAKALGEHLSDFEGEGDF